MTQKLLARQPGRYSAKPSLAAPPKDPCKAKGARPGGYMNGERLCGSLKWTQPGGPGGSRPRFAYFRPWARSSSTPWRLSSHSTFQHFADGEGSVFGFLRLFNCPSKAPQIPTLCRGNLLQICKRFPSRGPALYGTVPVGLGWYPGLLNQPGHPAEPPTLRAGVSTSRRSCHSSRRPES
jgi:hypothetical protein